MEATLQGEVTVMQQVTAMLTGSAWARTEQTAYIRVTGTDRMRWLNGMLTNSIQELAPGHASYNFALNAQGRILGDMNVMAPDEGEALLIQTDRSQVQPLMAHLDHFVIMDDVELQDASGEFHGILLVGPHSGAVLGRLGLTAPAEPLRLQTAAWNGAPVAVFHAYSPLVPRFELWSDETTVSSLLSAMSGAAVSLSAEALEDLRVLEGTPRYGVDIRNTEKAHDLAQETTQEGVPSRALHFSKGCYLGQEIVERVRSRGSVHRAFSGFRLTGTLPHSGTLLQVNGKSAGELTTVAAIPFETGTVQLALGYIRRQLLETNTRLEYPGGIAEPARLPYRGAAA